MFLRSSSWVMASHICARTVPQFFILVIMVRLGFRFICKPIKRFRFF